MDHRKKTTSSAGPPNLIKPAKVCSLIGVSVSTAAPTG
eukprot:SAG31_NODE_37415_length_304_cov_1.004878_1_plen_37_part_10